MESRIHEILRNLKNDELEEDSVFKYHRINQFLYDLLINNEIWFSSPYSFNDPFDCNITIDGNNTPEQIRHYFNIDNWKGSSKSDYRIQRLIDTNFEDKEAFQNKINSISKNAIARLGLTCFTQTNDNLLMWSHYTEDHKGICLEFDYKKDNNFFKPLKKVTYSKAYPIYNYYNDKQNVVGELMLNKSDHWNYENEIRVIKDESQLYSFNPESLIGIYFGARTTDKQIKTIMGLVRGLEKYQHVNFFRASIHPNDYRLIFKKYEF